MIELKGRYELTVTRKGKVVHTGSGRNLVTTLGENLAADRFALVPAGGAVEYLETGEGTDVPRPADTALDNTHGETLWQADSVTATGDKTTAVWDITFAAPTKVITEIGLFNALSGGDLVARFLTQTFNVESGDVMLLTWVLQFTGEE